MLKENQRQKRTTSSRVLNKLLLSEEESVVLVAVALGMRRKVLEESSGVEGMSFEEEEEMRGVHGKRGKEYEEEEKEALLSLLLLEEEAWNRVREREGVKRKTVPCIFEIGKVYKNREEKAVSM